MAEARELNHSYVGTEHLLLGLLREEKGIAAQVLTDAGVSLEASRAETLRLLAFSRTGALPAWRVCRRTSLVARGTVNRMVRSGRVSPTAKSMTSRAIFRSSPRP